MLGRSGDAIMTGISSAQSGNFKISIDIQINRLGFGAMRITGLGIWGEPADRPEALRTLKRLPELDVNFAIHQTPTAPAFRKNSFAKHCIPIEACSLPPRVA
jgi:hypothetical protein